MYIYIKAFKITITYFINYLYSDLEKISNLTFLKKKNNWKIETCTDVYDDIIIVKYVCVYTYTCIHVYVLYCNYNRLNNSDV